MSENRLASYYHWTGMGTRAAYDLMDRLHGFAQRPLVDVQLARSEPMLDPRLFARRGFGVGSLSLMLQFFAQFGFLFVSLQYKVFLARFDPGAAG